MNLISPLANTFRVTVQIICLGVGA